LDHFIFLSTVAPSVMNRRAQAVRTNPQSDLTDAFLRRCRVIEINGWAVDSERPIHRAIFINFPMAPHFLTPNRIDRLTIPLGIGGRVG
jgi:hypothetical protein